MNGETMKRETSDAQRMKPRVLLSFGVVLLMFVVGLTACSDDIGEAIDFIEYIGATGDVLDANGIDDGSVVISANGVGLDTPQSVVDMLSNLNNAGYRVNNAPESSAELMEKIQSAPTNWLTDRAQRTGGDQ